MVPISDDPVTFGKKSNPGASRPEQVDPIRLAVHVSLAIYLMPVVAIVCMIGGVSILAGGAAKIARQSVLGASRWKDRGQFRVAKAERHRTKPRLATDRSPSEAAL